tara:strand:+ start:73 stop:519 length:447 start_codon:yes stop_codon:yes gene_type:complete
MATTTATVSIFSSDLIPGMPLSINASSTLMQTGLTTGLELMQMGKGKLTQASGADALFDALGAQDSANYFYLCNLSTDDTQYIKFGIHDTVMGLLGAGEWMFIPWNQGEDVSDDGALEGEINIEAEPSGTIPYEYALFTTAWTLPAKS